jgi:hypothetical protein
MQQIFTILGNATDLYFLWNAKARGELPLSYNSASQSWQIKIKSLRRRVLKLTNLGSTRQ